MVLSFFANKRKDLIIDFQAKLLKELSLTPGALQKP